MAEKRLTGIGLTELITKIKTALSGKVSNTDVVTATTVDIDSAPTSGSTNLVTSGGVYDALHPEAESHTIETSDWSALASSSPFTYQATITATGTIGASTIVELLNDDAVTFATYGFCIGAVSGQSVTIYSIGVPSASVTLKLSIQ